MEKFMKFYKTFCVVAGFGLATLATSVSAETWRFGLEEIEGSVQAKYAEAFKDLVEKKSDGDIDVQILAYGKWGSSYSALYDAIQNGALQIGFGSGALGGTVPESQLLSLNYVMSPDELETVKILNSDAFLQSDAWRGAFRDRGLVPMAELAEGFQVWTTNKSINTPADMKTCTSGLWITACCAQPTRLTVHHQSPLLMVSCTVRCSKDRLTLISSRYSRMRKWAFMKFRIT